MKQLLFALLLVVSFSAQAKNPLTIETHIHQYAMEILGDQTVHTINHFNHPKCIRDVVEFVIVQKAIKLGGSTIEFEAELGHFDARHIKLVKRGLLLVSSDSVWLSEAKLHASDVYISDPVIRKGEFYAGIYSAPHRRGVLEPQLIHGLSKLSFVTSKAWLADVTTLNALKPRALSYEADWLVMAKMVGKGWVDAMLAPFTNTSPFVYEGKDYKIQALEGYKVPLQDSRHFIVSKKHPLGKEAFESLQKGLKILRSSGFIKRAYTECGFFNPRVSDWKEITPN